MSDIIIRSWYGGLGDNLQHSTLPRRFSELGHDVYISNQIPYRNPEIKDLVWGLNPYVKGYSDAEPNAGDIESIQYKQMGLGFLGNWEKAHGLEPPYSIIPDLYYQPKEVKEIQGKTLVDITVISAKAAYKEEKLRDYLTLNYPKEDVVICLFHDGLTYPMFLLHSYNIIFVENIYRYFDLIYSCEKFVCLFSGGNAAAASLFKYKPIKVDCLCADFPTIRTAEIISLHRYEGINYIWI